jgi:maltose-binding protein MalE
MSNAYRRVMFGCTWSAVVGGSVYAALTSLKIPWRLNTILLMAIVVPALVGAQAWLTLSAHKSGADTTAAAVTVEVVGHLEARMVKVAEQVSGVGREQMIEVMRQMTDVLRADLTEEIRTGLQAARMHGEAANLMRDAQDRVRDPYNGNGNGTVSNIRRGE